MSRYGDENPAAAARRAELRDGDGAQLDEDGTQLGADGAQLGVDGEPVREDLVDDAGIGGNGTGDMEPPPED